MAECVWTSDAIRSHVLKELCERMACDQLDQPFWVQQYLVSPIGQTVEGSGADSCIQYQIHISRSNMEPEKTAALTSPQQAKASRQKQVGGRKTCLNMRRVKASAKIQTSRPTCIIMFCSVIQVLV